MRCAPSDHHWKVGGHPVSDLKMMMKVEEHRLGTKVEKMSQTYETQEGMEHCKAQAQRSLDKAP